MPINYRDAEDIIMSGREKAERRKLEFMAMWYKPVTEMMARTIWTNIPQEVRDKLPQDAVKNIEKHFGGV